MRQAVETVATWFIRMTVLTTLAVILFALWAFAPTVATALGIAVIVVTLLSFGYVMGQDSKPPMPTYYGNENKYVRRIDGTQQYTYKGR